MAQLLRTSQREAGSAITARQDFTASALSGRVAGFGAPYLSTGHLPSQWRKRFRADVTPDTFVVYSYGTPIAWLTGRDVVIPPVKYSMTTSKHQGIVRRAAASLRDVTGEA